MSATHQPRDNSAFVTDGAGREGWEAITFAHRRPDLPHCERCNDGDLCNCQVYDASHVCACMGFLSCPVCPRARSGMLIIWRGNG